MLNHFCVGTVFTDGALFFCLFIKRTINVVLFTCSYFSTGGSVIAVVDLVLVVNLVVLLVTVFLLWMCVSYILIILYVIIPVTRRDIYESIFN